MQSNEMEHHHLNFPDDPARQGWIAAHLTGPGLVEALLQLVDDSPYSLAQWIDAFIVLEQWLEAQRRCASIQEQLGYVHCSAAAAGSGASLTTLDAVVREMLDAHGFEHSRAQAGA